MSAFNSVTEIGRLTRDAEVRTTQGENPMTIAHFTLAVERRRARDGQQQADFIPCTAFGKTAEWIDKHVKKGTKIAVEGHLQSGSYTNKDGQKIYTLDVIVDDAAFAESKKDSASAGNAAPAADEGGFMEIPEGIDEELPFC